MYIKQDKLFDTISHSLIQDNSILIRSFLNCINTFWVSHLTWHLKEIHWFPHLSFSWKSPRPWECRPSCRSCTSLQIVWCVENRYGGPSSIFVWTTNWRWSCRGCRAPCWCRTQSYVGRTVQENGLFPVISYAHSHSDIWICTSSNNSRRIHGSCSCSCVLFPLEFAKMLISWTWFLYYTNSCVLTFL